MARAGGARLCREGLGPHAGLAVRVCHGGNRQVEFELEPGISDEEAERLLGEDSGPDVKK